MLENFLIKVGELTFWLALLAGLVGLVRYGRLPHSLRIVALLAIFDALMELSASILQGLHLPNLFLAPFILVGELVFAGLAYRWALQSPAFNRALPWLLGLFCTYALIESLLRLNATRYLVPLQIIGNLLQIGLAGLYFQKLLNELRVERLQADPFFWLSAALALYGLGNLFISLSSNYLLAHCSLPLQGIIFWGVRNGFNIQLYLAYCLALCLRPPQAQPLGV